MTSGVPFNKTYLKTFPYLILSGNLKFSLVSCSHLKSLYDFKQLPFKGTNVFLDFQGKLKALSY